MGRKALLIGLSIAIGVLTPLCVAEVVLRMLPVRSPALAAEVNEREPMKRFRPYQEFTFSKDWDLKLVNKGRTNNYGYVNPNDYDPSARTPLMAVIGDSYVEAVMVPYPETVFGRLAACAGGTGRVYSFGVSGAALSQYLAWADYARSHFRPDALAVIVVGNDFDQSLRTYTKSVPGFHYFRQDSSGLVLERLDYVPSTGRRIMARSALVRYFMFNLEGGAHLSDNLRALFRPDDKLRGAERYVGNTSASAIPGRLEASRRVLDEFLRLLPERAGVDKGRIVLLLDGMRPHLYSPDALSAAEQSYFGIMRRYFVARATELGFQVIDMQPRFLQRYASEGLPFEYPTDDHWNSRSHEEAATAIAASRAFRETFPGACLHPARESHRASRP